MNKNIFFMLICAALITMPACLKKQDKQNDAVTSEEQTRSAEMPAASDTDAKEIIEAEGDAAQDAPAEENPADAQ